MPTRPSARTLVNGGKRGVSKPRTASSVRDSSPEPKRLLLPVVKPNHSRSQSQSRSKARSKGRSESSHGGRGDRFQSGETTLSAHLPSISGSGSGHYRPNGGRKTLVGGAIQRRTTRRSSIGGSLKDKQVETEKAAALRIQTWWKLKFYNRNFFLVIKKAAEYARKEEEERILRAKQAKVTLSKFFLKAIQRFREKTKEAKRKKRIRATEMVHRLLLWRQARNNCLIKEHLRKARAVDFIFKMWKQSKIFARVRWRVADETMRLLLEDAETLERRHLMVQQRAFFDNNILIPHHNSDLYLTAREMALEEELKVVRLEEDDAHSALVDEAMYGAPHTSSVATIQRQLSLAANIGGGPASEVRMPKFSLGAGISNGAEGRGSTGFSPKAMSDSFVSGQKFSSASPSANNVHRFSTFGSVRQTQSQRNNSIRTGGGIPRSNSLGPRSSLAAGSAGRGSFFSPTAEALISPQTRNSRSVSALNVSKALELPHRSSLVAGSTASLAELTHRPKLSSSTNLFTRIQPDALFMRPKVETRLSHPGRVAESHFGNRDDPRTGPLQSPQKVSRNKEETVPEPTTLKFGLSHGALGSEWAEWFNEAETDFPAKSEDSGRLVTREETKPPVTPQGHEHSVERGLIQEHRRRERLEDQWLRLLLSILHREEEERCQIAPI